MASLAPLADLEQFPQSSTSSSVTRQQSALPSVPTCHLCKQPISDPYTLIESGESFDKACVDRWLVNHDTCPVTNTPLVSKALVPNFILRDIVNSGLKEGAPVVCPVSLAPAVEKLAGTSVGAPESHEDSYDVAREDTLGDEHNRGRLRV